MNRKGESRLEMFNDELLNEAFRIFDKDGDGLISEMEIRSVMSNLGNQIFFLELIGNLIREIYPFFLLNIQEKN